MCAVYCGTDDGANLPKPGDPNNVSVATATAVVGGAIVSWTIPSQNAHAVSHVRVYRSNGTVITDAVLVATVGGNRLYDKLDVETPSEFSYWLQVVSINGTVLERIFAGSLMVDPDIGDVIRKLSGKIDNGALASSLKGEISRIETLNLDLQAERDVRRTDMSELGGAINDAWGEVDQLLARVSQEELDRIGGDSKLVDGLNANGRDISDERTQRIESLDRERRERIDAVQFEQAARVQAIQAQEEQFLAFQEAYDLDRGLYASQLDAISASYQTNVATIYTLEDIRISDQAATATRIDGLDVRLDDTAASLVNESRTRADGDSALSSEIGILSAKIDALPTFANGFEAGLEFDRWQTSAGHTMAAYNASTFSGDQAAEISSTEAVVGTASVPFAVSALIPDGTASSFSARRLRLSLAVKAPTTGAAAECAVGYVLSGGWFSGWTRLVPTAAWVSEQVTVEVPEVTNEDHYVVLWGDTSGSGNTTLVDRLLIDVESSQISEVTAAIETEQAARADADAALASDISALKTVSDSNTVAISDEQTARSNADSALATDITTLTTVSDQNAADIANEQTARADADSAMAEDITDLWAGVDGNETRITDEATVRSSEDDLLGAINSMIAAAKGASQGAAYAMDRVRVQADSVTATRITGLEAEIGDAQALIQTEKTTRASEDAALATQITSLQSTLTDDLNASITLEQQTRADKDASLSTSISSLITKTENNESAILAEETARTSEDAALASSLNALTTRVGDNEASILSEASTRSTADSALASDITALETTTGNNTAAITAESTARTDGDSALASDITTTKSLLDTDIAAVQSDLNTQVTRLDGRVDATAQDLTTVESSLSGDISSVQTDLSTNVTRIDGELVSQGAQYTAQVQTNGLIGGFGVYNNGTQVDAGFDVDRFWIGRTDTEKAKPFIVSGGSTYIKSAMIQDATITNAKIGNAQVSTLKIGNNAVTVPTAVSASSGLKSSHVGSANAYRILSVTVSTSGGPVLINASTALILDFGAHTGGYGRRDYFLDLVRDGVTIVRVRAGQLYNFNSYTYINGMGGTFASLVDHRPAGSYTYELKVFQSTSGGGSYPVLIYNRSITCLEVKR